MDPAEKLRGKLDDLGYPGALQLSAEALLFAGTERYKLLEWILSQVLGEWCAPSSWDSGLADVQSNVQSMADLAFMLQVIPSADHQLIEGFGEYSARLKFLDEVVDLLQATKAASPAGLSPDGNEPKDYVLIDALAAEQERVLPDHLDIFADDMGITGSAHVLIIEDLQEQMSGLKAVQESLHLSLEAISSHTLNLSSESTAVDGRQLGTLLLAFLAAIEDFNEGYEKDIQPWALTVQMPEVYGLGFHASGIKQVFNHAKQFLETVRQIRSSYSAVDGGGNAIIQQIVSRCESLYLQLQDTLLFVTDLQAEYSARGSALGSRNITDY